MISMSADYSVALYLRLSRDDNNGNTESLSIENQRDLLVAYANERGWKIRDIYIDDGYSGTTFDRPEFKRMKKDIELGKINLILTKDLSRLGRNYTQTGYYMEEYFLEHNVRYIAINDDVDTMKDNDIIPFKNVLNEFYAKDISKKIRSVRNKNAKQGKFLGSKAPYGYIKSTENKYLLVIDEKAAKIVKRIFTMYSIGESGRNIATKLNSEGESCPRAYYYNSIGKANPNPKEKDAWGSSTVLQLLRNQAYIGNMVQGKRVSPSFKSKKRNTVPKDLWIVNEGTHEPIIDLETWNTVQKLLLENKNVRVTDSGEISLFAKVLYCADCGSLLTFTTKRLSGKEYFLYRCSKYCNNGRNTCSAHQISLQSIENIVLEDIKLNARLLNEEETILIDKLVKLSNSENEKLIVEYKTEIRNKKNRFLELDTLILKTFEDSSTGNISDNIMKKLLSNYEKEQLKLTGEIELLEAKFLGIETDAHNISNLVAKLKVLSQIKKLDRFIVSELIEKIIVSESYKENGERKQDIKINYKFVGCLQNLKLCS